MSSDARYDVFLSYNRLEKEAALWLEVQLRKEGIRVFFDERSLVGDDSLLPELAQALYESLSCAVLFGPSGTGTFHRWEIDTAVQREAEERPSFRIFVLTLPGADLNTLPLTLRRFARLDLSAGLNDQDALRRLIDVIRRRPGSEPDSAGPILPPYRSMAPRVEGFVPRPELEPAVAALVRESEQESHAPVAVALTTALRGAGGFGKTALAQAVCELEAVRRRYPAGILWTTLGQQLSDAQRLARIRDLLRWWTRKEPPFYETIEAAAGALREALDSQAALLVLDDVWLAADVAPFSGILPPTALLLTTRNTRAFPFDAKAIVVDALQLPRAVELLAQGLVPTPSMEALEQLARGLGEWPILLKLVNAQLREEYRGGTSPEMALRIVEGTLNDLGLTAFDREDEKARELAVRRTVEASLQRLSTQDKLRYDRLVVFPEDEQIPLAVLELLWEAGDQEVLRLCRRFAEMSLLYRFDSVGRWIQLHDVMRAYLLREHLDAVETFHGAFLDSYRVSFGKERVQREAELYFVSRLPYHLKASDRLRDLEELLFSYRWLEEKVQKAGVNAAMSDYELLEEDEEARLVGDALRLSRAAITRDLSQLASQLQGRLGGRPSAKIQSLLERATGRPGRIWLRPLTGTFQGPSGPLIESFQAHQGEVRAIIQLDENRIATAATDGEIHVWELASGERLVTLSAQGSPVRHLAVAGINRLLSASDDGIIRLWDLEEVAVIRAFEGHQVPVTAFCFRNGEFLSGAEDGTLLRWSVDNTEPLSSLRGHTSRINGIGYLDVRTIVSISKDTTLRVWNVPSGRALKSVTIPPWGASVLQVTSSSEVVLGAFAGDIQIWKPLKEAKPRRTLKTQCLDLPALCVLGRDLGVAANFWLSKIQLWNPSTATAGPEIHVSGGGVTALARFGAEHLLCGSKDGSVSVWAIDALRAQMTQPGSVYAVAPVDSTTVVSTSTLGLIHVWTVPDGVLLRTIEGHSEAVSCVCTLGVDRIASCSSDCTIRFWNPKTGELLHTIQCPEKPSKLAQLNENILVSGPLDVSQDKAPIRIWFIPGGQQLQEFPVPGGVAAFSVIAGDYLLVGTYNGVVWHFDCSGRPEPRNFILQGHEKGVLSLAVFGQNRLASGSLDKSIRLWDLTTQKAVQVLLGHDEAVTGLAFISSRILASASGDRTVKLWNAETGALLSNLQLDRGLSSLAIMPDGRTLVAGDEAGTVHFLRVEELS